jgi:hypothetical protein
MPEPMMDIEAMVADPNFDMQPAVRNAMLYLLDEVDRLRARVKWFEDREQSGLVTKWSAVSGVPVAEVERTERSHGA